MSSGLHDEVEALYPELFDVFADLHRHPEIGFEEHRTTARVVALLEEAGLRTRTSDRVTGAVGVLENGTGPVVALRADIDALPIAERTGLAYSSDTVERTGPPAMHACGHDIHTTSLVGAARILARRRDEWSGTVIAVAQPAEELGEGARRLIASRLLEGLPVPDVVLGQHVGGRGDHLFTSRAGVYEAGQRNWRVTVRASGGHAAGPHRAINPLGVLAQLVLRAQAIVGASVPAGEKAVLVPTTVHGGIGSNVIPSEAAATFCARALSDETLDVIESALERQARGLAEAEGGSIEIERFNVFPLNVNDDAALGRAVEALRGEFGEDAYAETEAILGSEDFGELPAYWRAPSAYWHFDPGVSPAVADADRARAGHSPEFAPDPEVALRRGTRALAATALEFLGRG
ncbi:M20 family metallopeptidase [Microbacterium sp. 18062]|uniref:M20 metallopeptidase family protein n=1 Tax=Microbacterium sp. 18062 TaxID=2681410 RepID=UPI001356D655|nr:amidohydrolase [Microbacterium sp. 18062]